MNALAWLGLASALLLVPMPAPASVRTRALARRGPAERGWDGSVPTAAGSALVARRRTAYLPSQWPAVLVAAGAVGGSAAAVVGVGVFGGPALGIAAGVLALTVARLVSAARSRRRRQQAERDRLAAVRLLVAELESGARPEAALGAAAEAAPASAVTFRAAARAAGEGADAALVLLADPGLRSLGHAWQLAGQAGVPLAGVLSGVALDLVARVDQARAVTAALSGARSTAALLAGLPLVGIGLGAAMGARPLAFLIQSPAGRLVCCLGVVLDAVGLLWTQRLARAAEST